MTHTPGPWIWDGETLKAGGEHLPVYGACSPMSGGSWIGEAKENSRLIAAAPDLLAALKDIVEAVAICGVEYGRTTEICQVNDFSAARSAIAKATGETT